MDRECSNSRSTPLRIRTRRHADLRHGMAARPSDPIDPVRDPPASDELLIDCGEDLTVRATITLCMGRIAQGYNNGRSSTPTD